MNNRLHYSAEALRDLDEIWDYIVSELSNPTAAERIVSQILDSVDRLSVFPEMGAPLLVSGKQSVPYRYLVCGHYLIFYHLEAERVLVDRVLYGRRDYMALLFSDQLEEEE